MLFSVLVLTVFQLCGCCTTAVESGLNNPNSYCGSDSEKIEKALAYAAKNSLPLEITRRTAGDERDFWLIDRAILLPENMELPTIISAAMIFTSMFRTVRLPRMVLLPELP